MSNERLEELTQKVYEEGVQKARDEAKQIINDAQAEAAQILKEAQAQANEIIDSARSEADKNYQKLQQDLNIALSQTLQVGKRRLADAITTQILSKEIQGTFQDPDFVKRLIEAMVQHWLAHPPEISQVHLILPEQWKEEMYEFFEQKLHTALQEGMRVTFDAGIKGAFIVQQQDHGYQLYFSDEQFEHLFKSFLRPQTRQILFEE